MTKRRKRTKAEEQVRRAKCAATAAAMDKELSVLGQLAAMDNHELEAFGDFVRSGREHEERIAKYTEEELRELQSSGKSESDWQSAAALTDAELETAIASDPHEAGMVIDWSKASSEGNNR
jgi:LPS O-antigen subunit length determinant protein (WzzB/FepE family)